MVAVILAPRVSYGLSPKSALIYGGRRESWTRSTFLVPEPDNTPTPNLTHDSDFISLVPTARYPRESFASRATENTRFFEPSS